MFLHYCFLQLVYFYIIIIIIVFVYHFTFVNCSLFCLIDICSFLGRRYASIDAFGSSTAPSSSTATSGAAPPLPTPMAAPQQYTAGKSYFVPAAMNVDSNDGGSSDPFSAPDPTPAVPNQRQ